MHLEEKRFFGYICPECGSAVRDERSAFALYAAAARIACECGKSELRAELQGDKAELYVPCGICGKTHHARCTAQQLLQGKGIALSCPDCKQLICYIGEQDRVEAALDELKTMTQKEKLLKDDEDAPEELFLDNVIMYEVLSELKEIAAREKGICCACGSTQYRMEVRRSSIDLICADCGAKLRIPAATDEDLDALCCHIKLLIPGKER